MWIELSDLTIPVLAPQDLRQAAARTLSVPAEAVAELRVLRRSVDARQHRNVKFLYRVAVRLTDDARGPVGCREWAETALPALTATRLDDSAPVVVGAGPAGLFAALALCEAGLPPVVVERGKPAPERVVDVTRFWADGTLDPNSNIFFGAGGAGTFSDGKLNTRSKDPLVTKVLTALVALGASETILYDAKPHIGTDRLVQLLPLFRQHLATLGARFVFNTRLDGLRRGASGRLEVALNGAWTLARPLVLACGHSAFDSYRLLLNAGVELTPKPLAIGVRLEHPAAFASALFQGNDPRVLEALGHVQYNVTAKLPDRGSVYSFCCCPGGEVVACATTADTLNVNGMSASRRDSPFTNAGLVTPVPAEEFAADAAGMLHWREELERGCFRLGGGGFAVPAQRATDFVAERASTGELQTSSRRPVAPDDLGRILPAPVAARLRAGLRGLDRKFNGWLQNGTLLGIETTTSAPVRIPREADGAAVNWPDLLPAGEGSGYAGGIVTSATDGWRAVDTWLKAHGSATG